MARPDLEIRVGLKATAVEAAAEETRQKLAKLFKEVEGKPTNDRIDSLLTSLRAADDVMSDLITSIEDKLIDSGKMMPDYSKVIDDISRVRVELELSSQQLKAQKDYAEALKLSLAQVQVKDFGTASYDRLRQDIKAITDEYKDLDKSREAVEANINSLQTAIQENVSAMNGLYDAAKRTNEPELWSQWGKQAYYVRTLKQEYAKLVPEYTQIEQRQAELNDLVERYAEGMQQVYTSTKRTYSTEDRQRVFGMQTSIERTTESVKKQTAELDKLEKKKERLKEQGLDFDNSQNVKDAAKEVQELDDILNRASLNMRKLNQEFEKMPQIVDLTKGPVRSLQEMFVQGLSTIAGAVENTVDNIVRTMPPAIQVVYGVVKAGVKIIINEIVNTAKQVGNVIKNVVTKALNIAATAAKNFAKALAKAASNTVLSPFRKLGDAIGNISKKANESDFSMKKFGRAILQYGIGVRSLYRLINKLRTALFEGFADLALAYEPFNESMSQIVTALNYLKNSFAAAFAPIVQYVAPVLSIFITKVAEAVQWIGQLIAALTGKEFVMALPVFKDYSEDTKAGAAAAKEQAKAEKQAKKAAEDEAKAEKKRNKALQDVQRTIAGFDDVEILKDNTKDDSDSDYGFDPSDYDFSTPTLDAALQTFKVGGPIQSGIQAFADMLKKAWETADAYNLGKLVSEQLKNLLEQFYHALPKIQEFFGKVASVVASFLAGFLSVPDTFKWLGLAISGVINTIFKTIQTFLSTFMSYDGFKNLGKAIYNTIVVALANINWDTIYDVFIMMGVGIAQVLNETVAKPEFWENIFITLTNALRAILIRVVAFATTLHWDEIGSALAAGIIAGIENFPLEEAIAAVRAVLNGLWQFFTNFVNGMEGHWREIGQTIAQFIIGIFEDFEPVEFANGVIQFLDGLWDVFMGFVETPGWDQVVTKITTAISTFLDNFEWREKADIILGLLNRLLDEFSTGVGDTSWEDIIGEIANYIETSPEVANFLSNIWTIIWTIAKAKLRLKWALFVAIGKQVLNGICRGILNGVKGIGTWIKTNVIDKIIGFFKTHFKINSPAKTMLPIGRSIIEGMTGGISEKIAGVKNWIKTHVFDKVHGAFETVFDIGGGVANKIKDIGSSIMNGFKSGVDDEEAQVTATATNTNTNVQNALKKGQWDNIGRDIMELFKGGISNMRDAVHGVVSDIQHGIHTALSSGDWQAVGSNIIGSVNSSMSNEGSNLSTTAQNIQNDMYSVLSQGDWESVGGNIITGIYNGVYSGWNWLYNTIWNLADDLFNAAKNALGIASPSKVFRDKIGEMIPAGIGIGIEANADSALGAVDDLSEGLVNTAKNIKIPPIAMGEVIPYNVANGQNDANVTLNSLLDVIQSLENSMLTREDLDVAIATIIRNLPDYYIGAEKLARIVNKGNSMLDRRYNPVST